MGEISTGLYSLREENNTIHVIPSSNASLNELKPKLYELLAKHEPQKQVRIHNVPYCLLPDATENILQSEGKQVDACNKCNLKQVCKGPLEQHHDSFNHAPFKSEPRELAIEVNRVCSFKCPFCFFNTFSTPNEENTLPKEKIFDLIDQMVENNIYNLRLFGGDPLLHKDIMQILKYAKEKNRFVIMNTNGIFKKDAMRDVMQYVDSIIISLHGFDEATEQELTGRGDLLKAVVKAMFELGHTYSNKTTVSTAISTHVLNNFDKFKKIVLASGVKNWALNRPLFMKKEFEEFAWLKFKQEDIIPLARKVKETNETTPITAIINNYPHCFLPEDLRHVIWYNNSCNGVYRMFYDIDGFYKPAPSLNINLGSELKESWEKNPFNDLGKRDFVPKTCQTCDLFMNCLGGSRTQAQMFHDDLYARDPYMRK